MGQYLDERRAIEGRFGTVWANQTPVKYENDKTQNPAKDPYVTLTILRGEAAVASIGASPLRRYLGIVIVRVFVPEGNGSKRVEELLELAESAFLDSNGAGIQLTSGVKGLITFQTPSPEVAGMGGGFYMSILRVPYYRDQRG